MHKAHRAPLDKRPACGDCSWGAFFVPSSQMNASYIPLSGGDACWSLSDNSTNRSGSCDVQNVKGRNMRNDSVTVLMRIVRKWEEHRVCNHKFGSPEFSERNMLDGPGNVIHHSMAIRSDDKCWPTMRQLFHLLFDGGQSEYFCCHLENPSSISTRVQVR